MSPKAKVSCAMLVSLVLTVAAEAARLKGRVIDGHGAPVRGVELSVRATFVPLSVMRTDADGRFELKLAEGSYVLIARKSGFGEVSELIRIHSDDVSHDVRLTPSASETVTVTAARAEAREIANTPNTVTIIDSAKMERRSAQLLPQTLREEAGISLQQTTTAQASPFVRGMTGQQVLNVVDGVRFNNSTFRRGPNQYTSFLTTAIAERVEVIHGPTSSQYGSDSLGGTIHVLTQSAPPMPQGGVTANLEVLGESASSAESLALTARSGGESWGLVVSGSRRQFGALRTGEGIDSHSAATRYLGVSSKVLGSDALAQTDFTQSDAMLKLVMQPSDSDSLTLTYVHGRQEGVDRYDQLNGGNGNLINRFHPQALHFAIAKFERTFDSAWLDSASATFSFNSQQDDREFQNINNRTTGLRSPITREENKADVLGYHLNARSAFGNHSAAAGIEFYDETISTSRIEHSYSSVTGDFTQKLSVRGRFPNGATYQTLAAFAEDNFTLFNGRVNGTAGVRYSQFTYGQGSKGNPLDSKGVPTVPAFRTTLDDITFNGGLAYALTSRTSLTANVSRGFRAPNASDYASIGFTGPGFEVPTDEAMRLGGQVGSLDFATRQTQGAKAVGQLAPEQLYNYELGLRFTGARSGGRLSLFDAEISDFIERGAVVLPQGAEGQILGGAQIIRQDSTGAVYTAQSNNPVLVRYNAGRVQLIGGEAAGWFTFLQNYTVTANASYLRGENRESGKAPSMEGGIPPLAGFLSLRWEPAGKPYWIETYSQWADEQDRLSPEDLTEQRIGASRNRSSITNYFNNGAVAAGLVRDGVLVSTGETLEQVLQRMLGANQNATIPLYDSVPGYATFNLRGGYRLGNRSSVVLILENILDRNYRVIGSGIDSPGRNAMLKFNVGF